MTVIILRPDHLTGLHRFYNFVDDALSGEKTEIPKPQVCVMAAAVGATQVGAQHGPRICQRQLCGAQKKKIVKLKPIYICEGEELGFQDELF